MTDNKKLFPGVSQKDLDKKQRIADKNAARLAAQEKAQTAEKQRAELLQKFGVNMDGYKHERIQAIKGTVYAGFVGFACWALFSFYINGFIDIFQNKKVGSKEWAKPIVNPFVDGKFAPTAAWYRQLAFLVVSLCIAIGTKAAYSKDYREIKDRVDAVDMMTDLEKFVDGAKLKLNPRQIKHLLKTVPFIIESMSADKRVYFDMLMSGKIDIKNNKTFMDMAIAIMSGHLQSHPEDAKLILDTFEEKSLPDVVRQRCEMYQNRAH